MFLPADLQPLAFFEGADPLTVHRLDCCWVFLVIVVNLDLVCGDNLSPPACHLLRNACDADTLLFWSSSVSSRGIQRALTRVEFKFKSIFYALSRYRYCYVMQFP